MTIRTVIFDLDDTLLWDKKSIATAFELTCKKAAEQVAVNPSELEVTVREAARNLYASYPTYDYTQMIGINPFEGLWGTFDDPTNEFQQLKAIVPAYRKNSWTVGLAKLGIDNAELGAELGEYFIEARKQSPFVYEETYEVLDALKGNYKLILLTNGSPSLQHTKLEITPEIAPYFDHIVISGDFGRGKPDASIFEHVLKIADIQADEAIMVGDNLMTDILGSSRINMRSAWINREEKAPVEGVTPTYEIESLLELLPLLKTI
ncbi:HAD family hydrolase [Viridibacillus sp. YIM B01967]|uniref:Phosphoserine phosphatase n=1 Tax=Viridibacillus soli TaxID=2798301 RepID=A0ABS1H959_9BACL|nr:HAD family hydrolase [Viridibacillus soli]MBK3495940.1 HAD family hydrolase [Viridibacillus soli]